jgi:hypothetical protein
MQDPTLTVGGWLDGGAGEKALVRFWEESVSLLFFLRPSHLSHLSKSIQFLN